MKGILSMRRTAIAAIVAMSGVVATASDNAATPGERTVTVCMEANVRSDIAMRAQWLASKMFAEIGVTLHWRDGLRHCPPLDIDITLDERTSPTLKPGALAYALPYEGTHIHVFYDRIAQHEKNMVPSILAHVLAHEITHILEGVVCHSASGIMKAHWDDKDLRRMTFEPLKFEKGDVDLIDRGLTKRAANAAMAMSVTPVAVREDNRTLNCEVPHCNLRP